MIPLDDKAEIVRLTNALDRERQRNQQLVDTVMNQHALLKYRDDQVSAFLAERAALKEDMDLLLMLYNKAVGVAS